VKAALHAGFVQRAYPGTAIAFLAWTRRGVAESAPSHRTQAGTWQARVPLGPGCHHRTGERSSRQRKILPLSIGWCPAEQARAHLATAEGPRANWIPSRIFRRSPCCWPVHRRLATRTRTSMPNAAWMSHLSEWTLIFQGNHTTLNQRVQGSTPCAPIKISRFIKVLYQAALGPEFSSFKADLQRTRGMRFAAAGSRARLRRRLAHNRFSPCRNDGPRPTKS
jgi:hypothetical protein